jgi:hypothetical protein
MEYFVSLCRVSPLRIDFLLEKEEAIVFLLGCATVKNGGLPQSVAVSWPSATWARNIWLMIDFSVSILVFFYRAYRNIWFQNNGTTRPSHKQIAQPARQTRRKKTTSAEELCNTIPSSGAVPTASKFGDLSWRQPTCHWPCQPTGAALWTARSLHMLKTSSTACILPCAAVCPRLRAVSYCLPERPSV